MRKIIAALMPLLLLASCAWWVETQAFRYDTVERPARPADHPIPVIADTTRIERPYSVIGMVRSDVGTLLGLLEGELKEDMRREARKMGGDALINLRRRPAYGHAERPMESRIPDGDPREDVQYRWTAEVITYDLLEAAPGALQPGETAPERP